MAGVLAVFAFVLVLCSENSEPRPCDINWGTAAPRAHCRKIVVLHSVWMCTIRNIPNGPFGTFRMIPNGSEWIPNDWSISEWDSVWEENSVWFRMGSVT